MVVPETPGSGRPRKRFGQHFLNDHAVIERIVETLYPRSGEIFCEIGPGRVLRGLLRRIDRKVNCENITC